MKTHRIDCACWRCQGRRSWAAKYGESTRRKIIKETGFKAPQDLTPFVEKMDEGTAIRLAEGY